MGSLKNMVVMGGALAYGISPLDILPDIVPPITWIDDVVILVMAIRYCLANKQE